MTYVVAGTKRFTFQSKSHILSQLGARPAWPPASLAYSKQQPPSLRTHDSAGDGEWRGSPHRTSTGSSTASTAKRWTQVDRWWPSSRSAQEQHRTGAGLAGSSGFSSGPPTNCSLFCLRVRTLSHQLRCTGSGVSSIVRIILFYVLQLHASSRQLWNVMMLLSFS
jgi:hypothetical protein